MWRYVDTSTMFSVTKNIENKTIYGLTNNTNIDTHLMKNMEWGAVAYLSHSKYGKYGNENYSGENKQLYINNYRDDESGYKTETGCSSGIPYTEIVDISCPYSYPGLSLEATGASTTGNIHGVYDMSGGVWEYVMGQTVQEGTQLGTFYSSLKSGTWDEVPELKYYDSYEQDSSNLTHGRGYLGDATRETLKIFGKGGNDGWYNDFSYFPNVSDVWFLRGGPAMDSISSGIFAFSRGNGLSGPPYHSGFRVVLGIE